MADSAYYVEHMQNTNGEFNRHWIVGKVQDPVELKSVWRSKAVRGFNPDRRSGYVFAASPSRALNQLTRGNELREMFAVSWCEKDGNHDGFHSIVTLGQLVKGAPRAIHPSRETAHTDVRSGEGASYIIAKSPAHALARWQKIQNGAKLKRRKL